MHVATKLNRSHIVHGKQALILPCLARTDKDQQAGGLQGISVEDSMSMVHISYGMKEPARRTCGRSARSSPAWPRPRCPAARRPGSGTSRTTTGSATRWRRCSTASRTSTSRVRHPHGFRISQPARERGFLTPSGRAEFGLAPLPDDADPGEGRLMLATVRSHDQFNTTIYSNDDRYRGLKGLRTVVFMNDDDMRDRGLERVRPDRHHQLQQGRQPADRLRLPRRPLRDPARLRGGIHARAERPVRHRRLQHAKRAARHEAPRRRDHPRPQGRTRAGN